jgi:hypothetical protein
MICVGLLGALVVSGARIAGASARPPRAGRRVSRSITLEWVGDIALSTQRGLPPGGLEQSLGPVRGLLRSADETLGNLEGTLSVGGVSKCGGIGVGECFAFQAPPSTAFALRGLGFDLVNPCWRSSGRGAPCRRMALVRLPPRPWRWVPGVAGGGACGSPPGRPARLESRRERRCRAVGIGRGARAWPSRWLLVRRVRRPLTTMLCRRLVVWMTGPARRPISPRRGTSGAPHTDSAA